MSSLTISQTKEETAHAIAVNQNAQITNVRLARAKIDADRPAIATKNPITISMDFKAKHIEGESGQLLVEVSFNVAGAQNEGPSKIKTVFCINCTFELSYDLKPEFAPTVEQIRAFKDGNAIFNCWPYCRQYVQETILRLGYPPLILPFLRVQTKHRENRKLPKTD